MRGGRITIMLGGFWKGITLHVEHPELERMSIITNWARELLVLPCLHPTLVSQFSKPEFTEYLPKFL